MPGLQGDSEPVSVYLKLTHESGHARGNGSEVMVIKLLVLRGHVPHERAAGDHQVGPGRVQGLVDEEILLLPSEIAENLVHGRVEETADGQGGVRNGLDGLFQRGLVVQCLAGIGNENGRDTEGVTLDENRGGRVPRGISTRLEGGADASAGEGGSVGFLLCERLAVELFYHSPFTVILNQGVVLLGGAFGKGLEPVRDMGHVMVQGPFLHAPGDSVGGGAVEGLAVVDAVQQCPEHVRLEIPAHLRAVAHEFAVILGSTFLRDIHGQCLLLEGIPYQVQSVAFHILFQIKIRFATWENRTIWDYRRTVVSDSLSNRVDTTTNALPGLSLRALLLFLIDVCHICSLTNCLQS